MHTTLALHVKVLYMLCLAAKVVAVPTQFHHIWKYGPSSPRWDANSTQFPPNFWHYFITLVPSMVSIDNGQYNIFP